MAKKKEKKAGKKKPLAQKPVGKKKEKAKEIPTKGGVFASPKKTLPKANPISEQKRGDSTFASLSKAAVQKNVGAARAPKQGTKLVPEKEEKPVPAKAEAKFASTQELAKIGLDSSIVFYPLITEKAVGMIEAQNKLCFVVSDNADKASVKRTIETMYGVKIRKVNIVRDMKGRKKAIVKLDKKFKADEIAMKLGVI